MMTNELITVGASTDQLVDQLGVEGALAELGSMATLAFDAIKENSAKLAYSCWAAHKIYGLPQGRPRGGEQGGFAGWADKHQINRSTAQRYRDMGVVLYEDTGLEADTELAKLVAEQLNTNKVKKLKHDDVLRRELEELRQEKEQLMDQLGELKDDAYDQARDEVMHEMNDRVEVLLAERLNENAKAHLQLQEDLRLSRQALQEERLSAAQIKKAVEQSDQRAKAAELREEDTMQKLRDTIEVVKKAKSQGRGIFTTFTQSMIEMVRSIKDPTPVEVSHLRTLITEINNCIQQVEEIT